jgi:hypothetical protein
MNEFNNRMNVQRQVLACVNRRGVTREELCGLSDAAISRWAARNSVSADDGILALLRGISDKLSFLATKSQEQITEDYKMLSVEICQLTRDLEIAMG